MLLNEKLKKFQMKKRIYVRKSQEKSLWKIKPGNKNFGKKVPIF